MRERKINGSNYYHLTFYRAGSSFLVHQLERKNFSWNFLCLCHFRIRVVPEYAKILWGSKGWGDSTLFESFFEFLFPSSFTYFYYIVYFSESSDSFVYSVQSFFIVLCERVEYAYPILVGSRSTQSASLERKCKMFLF